MAVKYKQSQEALTLELLALRRTISAKDQLGKIDRWVLIQKYSTTRDQIKVILVQITNGVLIADVKHLLNKCKTWYLRLRIVSSDNVLAVLLSIFSSSHKPLQPHQLTIADHSHLPRTLLLPIVLIRLSTINSQHRHLWAPEHPAHLVPNLAAAITIYQVVALVAFCLHTSGCKESRELQEDETQPILFESMQKYINLILFESQPTLKLHSIH